jgi:ABC-type transport system involved in multi-copper enzyme maturation permease subunit
VSAIPTIAHLTLYDARRRKILLAAALCAALFLAVFSTAIFFASQEMTRNPPPFLTRQANLAVFSVLGLYAANFLSVLLAALLPVDALSGEIDSGVMQTLASKPVRRSDIVLGKWLGYAIVIGAYFLVVAGGVLLATRLTAGYVALNVGVALPLMVLELLLMLSVSIAGGTRLGTVTNGIATLGFYGVAFIGGWVEQFGALSGLQSVRTVGIAASLISPPDTLWRLAAYYLQPDIVRTLGNGGPFSAASVPSALMVWWALGFVALTVGFAVYSFRNRQL